MTQQRKHTRIDFETTVELEFNETKQPGKTLNISQGGALLETHPSLQFGQKLVVQIRLPKIKEDCRIPSVVRWCNESSVGVQFEVLRAIEVCGINQIIHSQNKE